MSRRAERINVLPLDGWIRETSRSAHMQCVRALLRYGIVGASLRKREAAS
ncbi:hypothetical protein [Ramlibacter sp. AN1133]